jgi:hypothetical protein
VASDQVQNSKGIVVEVQSLRRVEVRTQVQSSKGAIVDQHPSSKGTTTNQHPSSTKVAAKA